jgi:hypothetical protein
MAIIHGVDSLGNILPASMDVNGGIQVAGVASSFINPSNFKANVLNTNLPAGNSTQVILTVPASTKYYVRGVGMRYTGTVGTVVLRLRINVGGTLYNVLDLRGITSGNNAYTKLDIPLSAGEILEVSVINATLNDDFEGNAWGDLFG